MARIVARVILVAIIGLVLLMTYLAFSGNQKPLDHGLNYDGNLDRLQPQGIYENLEKHPDSKLNRIKTTPKPKPQEQIHVAYPVENVPGLEQVVKGGQSKSGHDTAVISNDTMHDDEILPAEGQALFQLPETPGENIISMTLYGSTMRYTMGAIRNAELIQKNFPGWKLRIYTVSPGHSNFGAIPSNVMESLRALGVDFYFMQPGEDFIPPMMWRFLVADDTWVDRFIVRDTDSRLTQRDAAAVDAWIQKDKPFTCIRDHPSHAGYAISGGLWGGKPRELRNILRRSWRDLMKGVPSNYLEDMNFLNNIIWPKVRNHTYCLDSVSCDRWPSSYQYPIPRYGYEHVGQVVNEHDLGRPTDIQILRNTPVNKLCVPTVQKKPINADNKR